MPTINIQLTRARYSNDERSIPYRHNRKEREMTVLQQLLSECIRSPEQLRESLHLTDQEVKQLAEIAVQYHSTILSEPDQF